MSIHIEEDSNTYILGAEDRADQLIEWSTKGIAGQRWIKDFSFGLRLGFVRDGLSPKMYIYWNQNKFNSFLKELGTSDLFMVTSYGVKVSNQNGETVVKLVGAKETSHILWDTETIEFSRQQKAADVNWVVGMVRISDDGPIFYTGPDSQQELEESSAVAIISDKPVQKVKSKNPVEATKRTILSNEARDYLLQDVILNKLIGNISK